MTGRADLPRPAAGGAHRRKSVMGVNQISIRRDQSNPSAPSGTVVDAAVANPTPSPQKKKA